MRKMLCPLIHSQVTAKGQSWADLKPGAQILLRVFCVSAGSQGFGPSLIAFSGHKQGAGWEVGLPGLELASSYGILAHARQGF